MKYKYAIINDHGALYLNSPTAGPPTAFKTHFDPIEGPYNYIEMCRVRPKQKAAQPRVLKVVRPISPLQAVTRGHETISLLESWTPSHVMKERN